jgi:hypothetical protein
MLTDDVLYLLDSKGPQVVASQVCQLLHAEQQSRFAEAWPLLVAEEPQEVQHCPRSIQGLL